MGRGGSVKTAERGASDWSSGEMGYRTGTNRYDMDIFVYTVFPGIPNAEGRR